MANLDADVIVVGGGIVGLATAYRLTERRPGVRVLVLEKDADVCRHQSGRNSGVLHSGIYYAPGSRKAEDCRRGREAMEAFCEAEGIPFERCGKVIVAIEESELPALDKLLERGQQNGVRCERVGPERLRELEPHAAGIAAIHVPDTGIADYVAVCRRLVQRIEERDGRVLTGARVTAVTESNDVVEVRSTQGTHTAGRLVNCAGLFSDRVARAGGRKPDARIIPFRGEYYEFHERARSLCRNLIYPVPDARLPFLGVHVTRMIDGNVECGPNAVLAFAREGYRKRDVNLRDLWETLTDPGFQRVALTYGKSGVEEMWRSFSKGAFVRAVRRLLPELKASDLYPARAGVRAQAVHRDGRLADDFVIESSGLATHVVNAPSPAATSSLTIADGIVDRLG